MALRAALQPSFRAVAHPQPSVGPPALGPGRPLEPALRSPFERAYGVDFGRVRIHDDGQAAHAAQQERAQAFTLDQRIVFSRGRFSPHTPPGRWLLAHELAHVAQPERVGASLHRAETDASAAASAFTQGAPVRIEATRAPGSLHRFGEPENVPDRTFVSTQGEPGFLASAVAYHQAWQLNPTRFGSIEEIVRDLGRTRGRLGRIRIVMHSISVGAFASLFTGEPLLTLSSPRLDAWAQEDREGLAHDLRTLVTLPTDFGANIVRALPTGTLLPALLTARGTPRDEVQQLIQRLTERFVYQTEQQTTRVAAEARQLGAMVHALTTLIGLLQGRIAQLTDAPAAARLVASIQTAVQAIQPTAGGALSTQDGISAANRAVTGGFRTTLDRARQRFDADSWIDIRGCRAGVDPAYLRSYSAFFGPPAARPHVSGPDWYQSFPVLGWRPLDSAASINALAAEPAAQIALNRWSETTGVKTQMELLKLYYRSEIMRRQIGSASTPGGLQVNLPPVLPPLRGGLAMPPIHEVMTRLLWSPPPLPRLTMPVRPRPLSQPTQAQPLSLSPTDPAIALAELGLAQLEAPNAIMHYYLGCDLVLPVLGVPAGSGTSLAFLTARRQQALRNWLGSQWRTAAPALAALQAGGWNDNARRVQALTEALEPAADDEVLFPPDPRYHAHIRSI